MGIYARNQGIEIGFGQKKNYFLAQEIVLTKSDSYLFFQITYGFILHLGGQIELAGINAPLKGI